MPERRERSGVAAASAPDGAGERADKAVAGERSWCARRSATSRVSTACSSGTNTLTLPAEGLIVPAKATTSSSA